MAVVGVVVVDVVVDVVVVIVAVVVASGQVINKRARSSHSLGSLMTWLFVRGHKPRCCKVQIVFLLIFVVLLLLLLHLGSLAVCCCKAL